MKVHFKRGKANHLAGADLVWHRWVASSDTSLALTHVCAIRAEVNVALRSTRRPNRSVEQCTERPSCPAAKGHRDRQRHWPSGRFSFFLFFKPRSTAYQEGLSG